MDFLLVPLSNHDPKHFYQFVLPHFSCSITVGELTRYIVFLNYLSELQNAAMEMEDLMMSLESSRGNLLTVIGFSFLASIPLRKV